MKKICMLFCLTLVLFTGIESGFCKDEKKEEKVFAIQNRIFHRSHELDLTAGYMSGDSFYYAYPIGMGYTFNFNEHWGWEVARGEYIFTSEKDILNDIRELGQQFTEFRQPKYMIHSHLMYKPLYGKSAWRNRGIINHETYFFLGGGVLNYEWIYPEDDPRSQNTDTDYATSISFGVGSKYFLNKNWCLNFEIRDMVHLYEKETENRIYFGIGLGWRFNFAARKADKNEDLEKLNEYLKKE